MILSNNLQKHLFNKEVFFIVMYATTEGDY